jgi:hypothetical protein
VGQADAARQHLLGVAVTHILALLHDNGVPNARARALEACGRAGGAALGPGLVSDLSVLDLVHSVLHLSAPPPAAPPRRDLAGLAATVSAAAASCGFGSLPAAQGEKLMTGVVLGERAMIQGGIGSFVTATQLERLHKQRSSAFAVIKSFYPLAPPDALNGHRLHIAFASKDFGFSSVGQLVLRRICVYSVCAMHLTMFCADQRRVVVAVAALQRVSALIRSRR